jgi:16S rRNA processing protein RimM
VGVVVGTHGTDGVLRVQKESDNPERFRTGAALNVGERAFVVKRASSGPGGALLLKLAGLDTREAAAALLQEPLTVSTTDTPGLPENTYYHYQLLDMAVFGREGDQLGTLTEVLTTGANDVYVVTGKEAELMVPALANVIVEVDVEAGRMIVDVPEGLLPRPLTKAKPKSKRPQRKRRPPKKAPRQA